MSERPVDPPLQRYERQFRFAPLGVEGQRALAASRVLIVGCGALGSFHANALARGGVGKLRIVDRDFVELTNLQRQFLYTEADVDQGLPKAIAAARHLAAINSQIEIEPRVQDVDWRNARELCEGVDLILDGTDNFETRFLLNDLAIESGTPWVFGGCLGAEGQSMTIVPGETACLRCLMPEGPPDPGTAMTCDTAGILAPIIAVIGGIQVAEALKILSGHRQAVQRSLVAIDLWDGDFRLLNLAALREGGGCPCCVRREFLWLSGTRAHQAEVLCGRNAVQLSAPAADPPHLAELELRLRPLGNVFRNEYLLRFAGADFTMTVFADGRTIVQGTEDPARARSLQARFLGS